MHLSRLLCWPVLALLLGACASGLQAPPHYVVSLLPAAPASAALAPHALALPVDDRRDVPDSTRIGEVLAPLGGYVPLVGGGGASPAVGAIVVIASVVAMMPTGRYLVVRDPVEVPRAVEAALIDAWLKSGLPSNSGTGLEATLRSFWITPSWTTTCDIVVELRLRDAAGVLQWQQTIASRVQVFEGNFAAEAFERVVRRGLDRLVEQAGAAFASPAFAAAAGADGERPPNAGLIER